MCADSPCACVQPDPPSGMGLGWVILCVLAAAAGGAAADSANISSIVDDPSTIPAFLDWDLGEGGALHHGLASCI